MPGCSGVRGCSVWWEVVVVLMVAWAEAGKIYTPGNLHEIRHDIAVKKCQRDPTCVLPPHLLGNRCKAEGGGGGGGIHTMVDKIMMETRMATTPAEGGEGVGGGCNKMAGEVVWPHTGECVTLLTQGPCPPGHWVKLNKTDFVPICQPQPCNLVGGGGLGEGAGVMVRGRCYPPWQLPPILQCPPAQRAITNEYGELECDCEPGYVFYEGDNTCYKPFTRGPCAPNHVLKVEDTESTGHARCFPNPCPEDRMVQMDTSCRGGRGADPRYAHCYPIGHPGPCDAGVITVDSNFAEPICLTTHSIFSSVVTPCSRGSRRDREGRCRTVTSFDDIHSSIPGFRSTRPGRGGCPPGTYFAGGSCVGLDG